MTDAEAPGRLPPPIPGWLAHGRALFNAGDFWASHESWERAWRLAPPGPRELIQGLIQAAASCHKLLVQDNAAGALRLAHRALANLGQAPNGLLDLALADFRDQLNDWAARLDGPMNGAGPIVDLPHLDLSMPTGGNLLDVTAVSAYALPSDNATALLVHVATAAGGGWGECRTAPGGDGVWQALAETIAPSLFAAPVMAPPEFAARGALFVGDCRAAAAAGMEAALWDAYAAALGVPLAIALGHAARPVPLTGRAAGSTSAELLAAVADLMQAGYRHATVPARPNADRRVLPAVAAASPLPIAIELGSAYRMADIQALLVLDGLGATQLARPFPVACLSEAARLCRLARGPISLGGWTDPRQLENALALHAVGAVELDPGLDGLTAASIMADMALGHGVPAWVGSSALTPVGALADLALAAHPGVTLPSDFTTCRPVGALPAVLPEGAGAADLPSGAGLGRAPDPDWLARHALRQAVYRR